MSIVTISVLPVKDTKAQLLAAFSGEEQGNRITFESPELLFKTFSQKRWQLIQLLTGIEPVSIREAARLANRDVKAVHGDITLLLNAGILEKTEKNKIIFPYDKIHVDFMLSAA